MEIEVRAPCVDESISECKCQRATEDHPVVRGYIGSFLGDTEWQLNQMWHDDDDDDDDDDEEEEEDDDDDDDDL